MSSTYAWSSWIFRRLVGLAFFLAFWSLAQQVAGLIGHDGILPAHLYLDNARTLTGSAMGLERFHIWPTIFWISSSDAWLKAVCLGGAVLSIILVIGFTPLFVLPLVWIAYLSLSVVGQDFLSFQWDTLLLETGFLAIFSAPLGLRDRPSDPPWLGRILLWWLLFRLMVGSGAIKLASGDPSWQDLTALAFHYETQPIPTPLAWYVHQAPHWFARASTAMVLAIELAVPFLIAAPRRWRTLASFTLLVLQGLIALTGNYAFFNLLAIALCVLLLDDHVIERIVPWLRRKTPTGDRPRAPRRYTRGLARALLIVVAAVTLPVSVIAFCGSLGVLPRGARIVSPLVSVTEPYRIVNAYGLFAVMTTTRPEIVVEGSNDGARWREYEFKYKAGDVKGPLRWVAPHQPRLDWQMWFAALGTFDNELWFRRFCLRLLEGSPTVVGLMARDPFGGQPPKFLRAVLYEYRFTDRNGRRADGSIWTRTRVGEYSPVLSLP